ncbi:TonB-dependent receptor [Erythrobacter sp. SCSIO 43205]|uniref:TonB-dependent receptor n=1 Tax=Erythrobacter sp. SCSIO 43205 TaxID=2779361 RepID=UPI001CAA1F2A|nr:TonB-dependent receptor [Erythrobacter sp. SCSIO 43205]UAB77652.1 TonB-dependent receptor [Erythrobacter sp. SCSIO 43205]
MRHVSLLSAASFMSLAIAAHAAPAHAQTATGADAAEDDNAIIVTARRQDERLQDVPASVSVLTADALEKTGAQNAADFSQLTPGVTIVTGTAEAGDTQINIRGINGARDAESSVALVVDGILKTNTAQLNQNQGTLRQVEILKGPQGALYGRNAAAGAIVLQTVKPGDFVEGGVRASYANENTFEGTAYVSAPLGEGIGIVASGYYRTTDGFFFNEFLNDDVVDDQEVWSVDGRLVANLSEATELDVKARYSQLRGASINFNSSFHIPAFGATNPAFFEDVNEHPFVYNGNIRPTNEQDSFDISAKIEHDFDSVTLTAWALYSDVDQLLTADGTSADFARFIGAADPAAQGVVDSCFATTAQLTGFPVAQPGFIGEIPVPFIFAPANGSTFGAYSPTTCDGTQLQIRKQSDISAEIRLASNDGGPLIWQLGGYFLNIDRETGVSIGGDTGAGVSETLFNAPGSSNPTSLLLNDEFDTSVYAIFGNAEYEFDTVTLGLALRYDIEDRSSNSLVPADALDPFTGGPINPGLAFGAFTPVSETFKQLQPKVSLSWQPSPDFNLYANWGIGFKSGGFNNQGSAAIIDANFVQALGADVTINDVYDKEVSSAFEVGLKGEIANGAITFDLAGYYTEIDDMQFFEFFVGSFGLLRVVSNIDEVEVYGLEFNTAAEIVDGWKIFGAINITESEIKANSSRPSTVGNKSPYTADYTINLGTEIDTPLNDSMNLIMRADYRITGPTWFHSFQDQTSPTLFSGLLPISALALPAEVGNANYSVAEREAFGVLNLRAGIEMGQLTATVFAENALNREYLNEVIPAIEFGGSFISPGARRLVGVEVGYRF